MATAIRWSTPELIARSALEELDGIVAVLAYGVLAEARAADDV